MGRRSKYCCGADIAVEVLYDSEHFGFVEMIWRHTHTHTRTHTHTHLGLKGCMGLGCGER